MGTLIQKTNMHYKKMRHEALESTKEVKIGHENIIKLEVHCKKSAQIIKQEKQKKAKSEREGEEYN